MLEIGKKAKGMEKELLHMLMAILKKVSGKKINWIKQSKQ